MKTKGIVPHKECISSSVEIGFVVGSGFLTSAKISVCRLARSTYSCNKQLLWYHLGVLAVYVAFISKGATSLISCVR